jgi:acyl carrier protein
VNVDKRVKDALRKTLGISGPIEDDWKLGEDLAIDDMDEAFVVGELEDEFGIVLNEESTEWALCKTVVDVVTLVTAKLETQAIKKGGKQK